MRKTKIVATIGPRSQPESVLLELIRSGLNVARLNMSHGDYAFHQQTITNLRSASEKLGIPVAILMDLQGPKIRVDKLAEPIDLVAGQKYLIGLKEDAAEHTHYIPTVYKNLVKDCEVGAQVLFDDGLLEAVVVGKSQKYLEIEVLTGGKLKSNKGINLPTTEVSAPSLTKKDQEDLKWGLTQDIDYVALSFVRNEGDVTLVKKMLKEHNRPLPIIAKIEKPEAVNNIEKIIEVSDGIMIARGDMAVEVGTHLVPGIQKKIIILCNRAGKPVITATQMLESMTTNRTPTRAEASDVANSVWDGSDALMLSGETANGDYPVHVLQTMDKIITQAELMPKKRKNLPEPNTGFTANVQLSGIVLAENTKAAMILSVTEKGTSCQRLAAFRPQVDIRGITNSEAVARKMCLLWGVRPLVIADENLKSDETEKQVIEALKSAGELKSEDVVVICRANAHKPYESHSNSIKILKV